MRRSLDHIGHRACRAPGVWGLVAFAARPSEAPPTDSLPVEFVSATEFSQLTAGVKNAPKPIENAKPLADKSRRVEAGQGACAQGRRQAGNQDRSPRHRRAAAESRRTEAPSQRLKPKPPEKAEKPKDKPKPDQIADELKKDEAKKPPKPERSRRRIQARSDRRGTEERRSEEAARPAPKFDANQVAALLDHREPQRQVATAETLNGVAALGASTGHAAHLSQSELDALRAKLISLWNPPAAVSMHPDQYVVAIRIRLGRDHRLVGQPEVLTSGDGPLFEATRDSAVRAVIQAQPYDMLSLTTYDQWKEIDINFDPREVFGG